MGAEANGTCVKEYLIGQWALSHLFCGEPTRLCGAENVPPNATTLKWRGVSYQWCKWRPFDGLRESVFLLTAFSVRASFESGVSELAGRT
jgi:hypothetical protein